MWKAFFTPRQLGRRFWVIPSWEKEFVPPKDTHSIIIDPGMAFGTGHHATTALCLEALEQVMENHSEISLLDVGCGSGILSIGAAMLGAEGGLGVGFAKVSVSGRPAALICANALSYS